MINIELLKQSLENNTVDIILKDNVIQQQSNDYLFNHDNYIVNDTNDKICAFISNVNNLIKYS